MHLFCITHVICWLIRDAAFDLYIAGKSGQEWRSCANVIYTKPKMVTILFVVIFVAILYGFNGSANSIPMDERMKNKLFFIYFLFTFIILIHLSFFFCRLLGKVQLLSNLHGTSPPLPQHTPSPPPTSHCQKNEKTEKEKKKKRKRKRETKNFNKQINE